jgi:hypothetical protein
MPLKALLGDRELIAPFLAEEEWAAIAVALRDGARLTLPCCGAAGGIRRSRLGRRFFYHRTTRQVPRCAWAGETPALSWPFSPSEAKSWHSHTPTARKSSRME